MNPTVPTPACAKCGGSTAVHGPTGVFQTAAAEWFAYLFSIPFFAIGAFVHVLAYFLLLIPIGILIVRWRNGERHLRCVACGSEVIDSPATPDA